MIPARTLGFPSAANRPLSDQIQAGPSAASIILGWLKPISLGRVVSSVVDARIVEQVTPLLTRGVFMPLSGRELELKPEGERSWNWVKIFATPDLTLAPDDVIEHKGTRYRVEKQTDWGSNGYVRYEAVNEYTKGNPV